MTIYKTRPGVILTEICGEYVLVAAAAIRKLCPYVTVISESSAFLWNRLLPGATLSALEEAVCEAYEIDNPEEARGAIRGFLDQMTELNYVLTEEGDEYE